MTASQTAWYAATAQSGSETVPVLRVPTDDEANAQALAIQLAMQRLAERFPERQGAFDLNDVMSEMEKPLNG